MKRNNDVEFRNQALAGLAVVSVVGLLLLGVIFSLGGIFVDRVAFESSYQYSESRKAEIVTYEAQLAEINMQLSTNATPSTRNALLAQKAAINIRLTAAKRK